jgi:hypothetical protein
MDEGRSGRDSWGAGVLTGRGMVLYLADKELGSRTEVLHLRASVVSRKKCRECSGNPISFLIW